MGTEGVQTVQTTVGGSGVEAMFGGGSADSASFSITTDLNEAAVQALQDPAIRDRLTNEGQFLQGGTPAQFAEFLRAEAERLALPTLA